MEIIYLVRFFVGRSIELAWFLGAYHAKVMCERDQQIPADSSILAYLNYLRTKKTIVVQQEPFISGYQSGFEAYLNGIV